MKATNFPALIQYFFTDRFCTQMEASPHTIAGYRDTFRLLVRYAGSRHGKPPTKLTIDDIDADLVADFLTHVESARGKANEARRSSPIRVTILPQHRQYGRKPILLPTYFLGFRGGSWKSHRLDENCMRLFDQIEIAIPLTFRAAGKLLSVDVAVTHPAHAVDYELRNVGEWGGLFWRPRHVRQMATRRISNERCGYLLADDVFEKGLSKGLSE